MKKEKRQKLHALLEKLDRKLWSAYMTYGFARSMVQVNYLDRLINRTEQRKLKVLSMAR